MRGIASSLIVALLLASALAAEAAPLAVRYPEGSLHGYLILRGSRGEELGTGELQQQMRDDGIHTRLVFQFRDGSLHDERVVFAQRRTFALRQYHLLQRGPSFPRTLEVSLDGATGQYTVRTGEEGKKEGAFDGRLELPPDVSNGMITVLVKNVPKGVTRTVHVVAFTPKPMLVEVEVASAGEDRFYIGEDERRATHYRLRPKLGLTGALAALIGKEIPDYHYWIDTTDGTPAFLAFEGPLAVDGPTWRVELAAPRWPRGQRAAS